MFYIAKNKFKNFFAIIKQWWYSDSARHYFKNSSLLMLSRIYWILAALSVGIYVTRKIGPENLGVLNYAISLTLIFSLFSNLPLDNIVIRNLVKHNDKQNFILGNFALVRMMSFITALFLVGLTLFFSDLSWQIKSMCLLIMIGHAGYIMQPTQVYFQATVQNQYIAIGQTVGCTIHSTIRLAAALFDLPLQWFAIAEAASPLSINITAFGIYWAKKGNPISQWHGSIIHAVKLFKTAIPLFVVGIMNMLYTKADALILKVFTDLTTVGFYTLATHFVENITIMGQLLVSVFFPLVVSASKKSCQDHDKQLHRLYFMIFWLMICGALVLCTCASIIISLLYGKAYLPAVRPLQIYCFMLPGQMLMLVTGFWAINAKRLNLYATLMIIATSTNLFLNWLLVPHFGSIGSAMSAVIGISVGIVIPLLFFSNGRHHLIFIAKSLFTIPNTKLQS